MIPRSRLPARRRTAAWAALLLRAATGWAASGPATAARADDLLPPRVPPTLVAGRLAEPPLLDGEVLDDPAWRPLTPATGFWQTTPDEGRPASERTEVRIAYTDEALYVGVVCYDSDPAGILVADSRRDSSLDETDSFQLVLDTFKDRQNGFLFGTNPAGVEYDGQVIKEGNAGFTSVGGSFNLDWDADWQVRARISEVGWSAELEIPFTTLRFGSGEAQSWGLNFQRNIRRRNETSYWAAVPRQYNLHRLSLAGNLDGLEVPDQRNLRLIPFAVAQSRRGGGGADDDDREVGFDLKYSITPSLTLDATWNTDFAQVEADEQQINLDRFNLFFPEKRPFFLENAGQFTVGIPDELELFFSRRIGIGPGGEAIPIAGGVRLTGKVGRTNLGFLQMRSEEVGGVAPENDYTVVRVNRELAGRSSLGVIAVRRSGDGSNGTFGVDGRWGIGEYAQVKGFVAATDTPGERRDEYAFRIGGGFDTEAWNVSVNYAEVADGFNPEAGFLSRRGYRRPDFFVMRRIRPRSFWGLHELRPHVSYRGFWNFDGFQETGFLHVDNHFEWPSGLELHTGVNFTREGVVEAFEIAPGVEVPPGTYDHREAQLVFNTDESAPFSFRLRATIGGFFGGDRVALTPGFLFRLGETFNADVSWERNDVDLPGGAFETNLARLRMSYSFTPRLFVQALVQYNDRTDEVSTNLRFGWLREANTGLFVVFNEARELGLDGRGIEPERAMIVKYSRIFNLLR